MGFNLPCYARGLQLATHADSADGLLDVCTFERGSLWHALRYYWHVARGVHANLPDVRQFRSGKFRVEADDGSPVAVQVDGDRAGTLPLDVEISRGALTMMVSAAGAERLGFTTTHD